MATGTPLQAAATGAPLRIPIDGMDCGSCVGHVEKAIAGIPDVTRVSVNLASRRADVFFRGKSDAEAVATSVRKAGYSVPESTVDLAVDGMNCASCVAQVEKALGSVPGVISA